MLKGLIIGYGRAGQRHGRLLDDLGIDWVYCDPNIEQPPGTGRISWEVITESVEAKQLRLFYNFVVICTPPRFHLGHTKLFLEAGLPVLCEKPLCDIGQLSEAEKLLEHPLSGQVMIAHNFRFHPALIQARGKVPQWMTCYQDRELPDWGLLLDHCSHDLDILRFLCGEVSIQSVRYYPTGSFAHDARRQMWEIMVKVHGLPDWQQQTIRLRESVGTYPDRKAKLEYEDGAELDIDPGPAMFKAMWDSFLSGRYEPGLEEAIKTQRLLEDAWRMANG